MSLDPQANWLIQIFSIVMWSASSWHSHRQDSLLKSQFSEFWCRTFKSSGSVLYWCPFAHHGSTKECPVATKPLWLDTVLLRIVAIRARKQGGGSRRSVVLSVALHSVRPSQPCLFKRTQRQLWQDRKDRVVREWQRTELKIWCSYCVEQWKKIYQNTN